MSDKVFVEIEYNRLQEIYKLAQEGYEQEILYMCDNPERMAVQAAKLSKKKMFSNQIEVDRIRS